MALLDLSKEKLVYSSKLMGEERITVTVKRNIPETYNVGDYIVYDSRNFILNRIPTSSEGAGGVLWTYNLAFESESYLLNNLNLKRNGSSKFTINWNLDEAVSALVVNMNADQTGWIKGTIPTTERKTLSFNNQNCRQVLTYLYNEFGKEYEVVGKTINFADEIGSSTGLTFEYGRGNGLYELKQQNVDDKNTVTRVYGFGSSRNLPTGYRSGLLDRLSFTPGFLEDTSEYSSIVEHEQEFPDIFPSFEGAITEVSVDWLTIKVPTTDFDVNDQLNDGQVAKIVFQSGDLLGQEFEISSFNNTTKEITFKLFTDESGAEFPRTGVVPQVGDTITYIDIQMPTSYVTAAETELEAATQDYLDENKKLRVNYLLNFDYRYIRDNVITLKVGDKITLVDTTLGINREIRMINYNIDDVNYPTKIRSEISDYIPTSFVELLTAKTVETSTQTVLNDSQRIESARQNALRVDALRNDTFDTEGDYFTEKIKPLSIETKFLAVEAKSQNFQLKNAVVIPNYNGDVNRLNAATGSLIHFNTEWSAGQNEWVITTPLDQSSLTPASQYYLYIKANTTTSAASWLLTTSQITVEEVAGFYHFLLGSLSPVNASSYRDFSKTNGATYIYGNNIIAGTVQDLSGQNYMNLTDGKFNMGTAAAGVDWDVTSPNTLTLRGAISQSGSGATSPIGVFRGTYSAVLTYYKGDEVTYAGSTWQFINATPTSGQTPTEGLYWTVKAEKGADFVIDESDVFANRPDPTTLSLPYTYFSTDTSELYFLLDTAPKTWSDPTPYGIGPAGSNGENGFYYDYLFQRSATQPSVDGTLTPAGWFSQAPAGTDPLWMIYGIKRLITTEISDYDAELFEDYDNEIFEVAVEEQQTGTTWTVPVIISGNPGNYTETRFAKNTSSTVAPSLSTGDRSPAGWTVSPPILSVGEFLWMTQAEISGNDDSLIGVWADATRISGETGDAGEDGNFVDYRFKRNATQPPTPTGDTPAGWSDVPPAGTDPLWMIKGTKTAAGVLIGVWSDPIQLNGDNGADGDDGDTGNYIEFQYAKNGSTTVPPAINPSSLNPIGWSITPPTLGALEYAWRTQAEKTYDGLTLVSNWTNPMRDSGVQGDQGIQGDQGDTGDQGDQGIQGDTGPNGPLPTGGLEYDNGKTYFGNDIRVDIVTYLGSTYVTRVDAGTFSGTLPTDTGKWNPFGGQYESLATDLLFASLAYIDNLGVNYLRTGTSGQRVEIDGATSTLKFYDSSDDLIMSLDSGVILAKSIALEENVKEGIKQIDLDYAGQSGLKVNTLTSTDYNIYYRITGTPSNPLSFKADLPLNPDDGKVVGILFDNVTGSSQYNFSVRVQSGDSFFSQHETTSGQVLVSDSFFLKFIFKKSLRQWMIEGNIGITSGVSFTDKNNKLVTMQFKQGALTLLQTVQL